jgi:hypothetical protein
VNAGHRPIPPRQVLASLRRAKAEGLTFAEAWVRAVEGEVCDDYQSIRVASKRDAPWPDGEGDPPHLRAATGPARCAGCRFIGEASICSAFGARVFTGVVWPPATAERQDWKAATLATRAEWEAAYTGKVTPASVRIAALSSGPMDEPSPAGGEPARRNVARA